MLEMKPTCHRFVKNCEHGGVDLMGLKPNP